jgi:hypothetical protein
MARAIDIAQVFEEYKKNGGTNREERDGMIRKERR